MKKSQKTSGLDDTPSETSENGPDTKRLAETAKETGGPKGPEPTRYGDWERKGKCVDF